MILDDFLFLMNKITELITDLAYNLMGQLNIKIALVPVFFTIFLRLFRVFVPFDQSVVFSR